jgi:hypothetical protein
MKKCAEESLFFGSFLYGKLKLYQAVILHKQGLISFRVWLLISQISRT